MTWTRRVFLRKTIGGWLGLVIAPGAYALLHRWLSRGSESEIGSVGVGSLGDFEQGSSRIVTFGKEKVIIGRLADGTFHAVSGVCTHLGCSIRLEQLGENPKFACNCHDSRFDLHGNNLSGPATSPLRRFEVENSGGELRLVRSVDDDGSG